MRQYPHSAGSTHLFLGGHLCLPVTIKNYLRQWCRKLQLTGQRPIISYVHTHHISSHIHICIYPPNLYKIHTYTNYMWSCMHLELAYFTTDTIIAAGGSQQVGSTLKPSRHCTRCGESAVCIYNNQKWQTYHFYLPF